MAAFIALQFNALAAEFATIPGRECAGSLPGGPIDQL